MSHNYDIHYKGINGNKHRYYFDLPVEVRIDFKKKTFTNYNKFSSATKCNRQKQMNTGGLILLTKQRMSL